MHMEMPDIRPLHRVAVSASVEIVGCVRQADLLAITPCGEWQLVDLLAHMTVQHRGFAAAARGFGDRLSVWHVESVRDAVTADPGTAYAEAASDVLAAFADNAVLDASFTLPDFGPNAAFPGPVAIGFHLVDYVVHGWDVASSLGIPFTLPDDVVEAALPFALLAPDGEARDVPDAPFGHVVAGPNETDLEKILRYLGREPSWTPGQR